MEAASEAIYQAALKLPDDERLTLASRLLETVPADDSCASLDDSALIEELDRRFADRAGSISWPELRAEK